MRNTIWMFALLVAAGLLAACGNAGGTVEPTQPLPTDVSSAETPTQDFETLARAFVDLLAAGDFDKAAENFDDKMAQVLPPEQLQEVWASLVDQVGPFQQQLGIRTEEQEGYRVVYVTTQFAQATLDTQIAIDPSGQIAGLFFIPTQTEAAVETPERYVAPDYVELNSFEEREIIVGTGDWLLPATFTQPLGDGPFPAVLLVHGSGPHDRDETIGLNKPFRDLAWGLASQGIAVLRYEKRTKEYAEQVLNRPQEFTLDDETVEDALAAVSLLSKMKDVDPDRIFVLGHSLGGTALPRIGAAATDLAGLIVMAGATRPLEDLYQEQVLYVFMLDGEMSEEEQTTLDEIEQQVARVKDPALSAATPASDLPLNIPAGYWLDLRGYDPAALAATLTQPMLILQGERDYQVRIEDFESWETALATRDNVTFQLYPSLNHLFFEGEGMGNPTEDYATAGHVAAFVINDIVAWLQDQ